MYDEVMRRPMFQTPQQRQASGIMAGVAPVRGYAGGGFLGEGSDLGDKLREGRDYALDVGSNIQDNYEEFLSTEDDDEVINVRDFTNVIFDPEDPLDAATLAITATGVLAPAAIAFKLGRMGYKGAQLARQMAKIRKARKLEEKASSSKTIKPGETYIPQGARSVDAPELPTPPAPPPGILGRAGSAAKTLGKVVGVGALGAGGIDLFTDTDYLGLKGAMATPETPEEEPQVNQVEQQGGGGDNEVERKPNIFQRISGGIGSLAGGTGFGDDGTTPGISERDLIRASAGLGEARSGRRRINPALDRFKASQVYDDAQKGTALQQNYGFLEEMFPDKDPAELMQLAAGKDPQTTVALTLFETLEESPKTAEMTTREVFSLAMQLSRQYMSGEVPGAGATDPSAEIK